MTDTTAQNQSNGQPDGPEIRVVVLLERVPAGIGEIVDIVQPGLGERLAGVQLNTLPMTINGVELLFSLTRERLVARELDYAVSDSLLRDRVQAAVDRHGAYLLLSAPSRGDVFNAANVVSNIAARFADDDNGLAVWLPDADFITTDVMYAGELGQRPEQVWFKTLAMSVDAQTSLAHTVGLHHLGGSDVQLQSTLAPATAFRELRGAVATLLEQRTLPTAGMTLTIAGVPHLLSPGTSMLRMGAVLIATPAAGHGGR